MWFSLNSLTKGVLSRNKNFVRIFCSCYESHPLFNSCASHTLFSDKRDDCYRSNRSNSSTSAIYFSSNRKGKNLYNFTNLIVFLACCYLWFHIKYSQVRIQIVHTHIVILCCRISTCYQIWPSSTLSAIGWTTNSRLHRNGKIICTCYSLHCQYNCWEPNDHCRAFM